MRERGIAVTLLDREIKGQKQCSVSVDDINGGQIAIEYLASLGHKNIAWVCGPESIPQVSERSEGVTKAAKASSVRIETIRVALMNAIQGEEAAKKILELPKRPSAIFCANDLLAFGVIRVLIANKVKVPEQISVLGYDNIDFAASAGIPLSSIAQPAYQMGVTAANLLLDECEADDDHRHQQIRFQPQLVERSSTGAAPK
jgi:LacI family transcriptional regulator